MEDINKLNVLAIFAHPDDEVGAIGTLLNHIEEGDNVDILLLTRGENASSFSGTKEEIAKIREKQAKKIENELGLKYHFFDIPDSSVFPSIENAKKVANFIKKHQPDVIITWGQSVQIGVGHPDHRYTHSIVLDAISYARYRNEEDQYPPYRRRISLYTPFHADNVVLPSTWFVDVTKQYDKIMKFFDFYEGAYGVWAVRDYKISSMKLFGRLCDAEYAEAFTKHLWRKASKKLE
ncbi:MAG: PIG-L family deacetylase [Candidatus Heimdallarchaeum aukensis]|uniref:PIG-L family deacetylase n=1 Tax=Candidatus Heimdallarchaeum aukensis TaxID=2876573 RepID=A0A9Y1BLC8_9ARCH|nr:MAG: PIG-L family deacetylase [Candidatus Heimdallarchaeum aukensis]